MHESDFQPVTYQRHGKKACRRYTTYDFAAETSLTPLVAAELPKALLGLPIAFITQEGDAFTPAAILGLLPGRNLFVGADGRWLGSYVPAVLRGYPFRLAITAEGKTVVCVDERSGLLSDDDEGERLYGPDKAPSPGFQQVVDFLAAVEASRIATKKATDALQRHGLLVPWNVNVTMDGRGERRVSGLFRVDEQALTGLNGDALADLLQAGALMVGYCQLLSMQNLRILQQLAEPAAAGPGSADLDFGFLSEKDDGIDFGGLE